MRMNKKDTFVLFLVLLFFLSIMVVAAVWDGRGEQMYREAYRPKVEQNIEWRKAQSGQVPPKGEPKAPGFSESEIDKQRGRRYATF